MDLDVVPEPSDEERRAIEAVFAQDSEADGGYESAWRRAGLTDDA